MTSTERNSKNWREQWRRGDLAQRPGVATTALAIALIACVICAQAMVQLRSHALLAQIDAEDFAAQVIHDVADQGLVEQLGRANQVRYYLHERNGQAFGLRVFALTPELRAQNEWVCSGYQFDYFAADKLTSRIRFTVTNDLSAYEFRHQRVAGQTHGGTRTTVQEQLYRNGVLQASYQIDQQRIAVPPTRLESRTLVCPPLLDYMSSLAASRFQSDKDAALFDIVGIIPTQKRGRVGLGMQRTRLLVQPGGEIPSAVADRTPDGVSVFVDVLDQNTKQHILYDRDHQLVWQQDEPGDGGTVRQVDRTELLQAFPEMERLLDTWLRLEGDYGNEEIL